MTGELAVRHERIGGHHGLMRQVAAYAERYGSDPAFCLRGLAGVNARFGAIPFF